MMRLSGGAAFTLVLLAFVGLMFWLTLDLGRVARLVPLSVVIPTLGLLALQLLIDLVPRLASRYGRWEETGPFKVGQAQQEPIPDQASQGRAELNVFFWILLMLAFFYALGFLTAVPLFTLLYLKLRSRERWPLSLAMAAGAWGFLYGVFVLILRTRFYEGLLWAWLGL